MDMFCVCHAVLSVHCSLVVRANLLALLYVVFSCVYVTVVLDCMDS